MEMTSYRGYLIRALNDWILDNDCTPYILVNAMMENVDVPRQYVRDGQIVLNISPTAVHALQVTNDMLSFSARFGGRPMEVFVPVPAVMGIYARENGQGMVFDTGNVLAGSGTPESGGQERPGHGSEEPHPDDVSATDEGDVGGGRDSGQKPVGTGGKSGQNNGHDPDKPPRGGKRPNLRIVK